MTLLCRLLVLAWVLVLWDVLLMGLCLCEYAMGDVDDGVELLLRVMPFGKHIDALLISGIDFKGKDLIGDKIGFCSLYVLS